MDALTCTAVICVLSGVMMFKLACWFTTAQCQQQFVDLQVISYVVLLLCPHRVYLDSTYAHPKHTFLPQHESIAVIVDAVQPSPLAHELLFADELLIAAYIDASLCHTRRLLLVLERLRASNERTEEECASLSTGEKCSDTLILLSAYNIGKEKILLAVAKATGLKIYCDARKLKIVSCLGMSSEDMALFTNDMHATPIHTCRFRKMQASFAAAASAIGVHVTGISGTATTVMSLAVAVVSDRCSA
eukprot:3195-Heterococcus_DN1.PRE.1